MDGEILEQNGAQSDIDQGAGDGVHQTGQDDNVQSQQTQQSQQHQIDYEKSYKQLEKEFTRRSQELKRLSGWKEFEERTGITAEQALQQLEAMQSFQQPGVPQPTSTQDFSIYSQTTPTYNDNPRISQLEQELAELKRERQIQQLRQRFPQFDEVYPQVIDIADTYGYDVETAFGKVLVDKWDEIVNNVQQQTVNKIRLKGEKQVERSNAPSPTDDIVAQLTDEELQAAREMGIDPKEYAKAKQGYSIDF